MQHLSKSVKRRHQTIKKSKKFFVFADKASNIYKIKRDEYNKLNTDTITLTYKKISDKIISKVNADGKKILENKEVVNQMLVNDGNSCFMTLKDHKSNFFKQPQSSLTKPSQKRTRSNQKIHTR